MDILFLSHCVPFPPDKGERIRAFHELNFLARSHRVHLACIARSRADVEYARSLTDRCASVNVQLIRSPFGLFRAGLKFIAGSSLTTGFYVHSSLRRSISRLNSKTRFDLVLAYSSAVAPYAPLRLPMILDLVDVDSEKWLQYAGVRHPSLAYRLEGQRLRRVEQSFVAKDSCSFLTTASEIEVLRRFSPHGRVRQMGNGVDFEYFDPAGTLDNPDLSNRRFLAFIGSMSYYPNVEAADWFARNIFRALRLRFPDLELFIVGRDPAPPVRALAQMAGVHVTGTVSDVRPYIKACAAVIAPMRIARGIQNKVLEALAMGKPVLASSSVCKTLSPLPSAVKPCETEEDYIRETQAVFGLHDKEPNQIRQSALAQFTWEANLRVLSEELCRLS